MKTLTRYSPEVAAPVESFKQAYDRLCSSLRAKDIIIDSEAKEQLWLFFEDNYTTATMSMFGWKEVAENEREKKRKAMNVIAEIITKD
jgi:hypothetical protein